MEIRRSLIVVCLENFNPPTAISTQAYLDMMADHLNKYLGFFCSCEFDDKLFNLTISYDGDNDITESFKISMLQNIKDTFCLN